MKLQSMTGFARAARGHGALSIQWEIKSFNGKGLDVRLRLPSGFERLEHAARQAIQKRFSRGNMQAALAVTSEAANLQPVVNEEFLKDVAELAQGLVERFGATPATADGLLSIRGVLDLRDPVDDAHTREGLDTALLEALEEGLDDLAKARLEEGAALKDVLLAHLATIESLTLRAEADPSREIGAIRERVAEQVRLLLDAAPQLDESRLHAEAVFLAAKADIREEIDRLKAHVQAARSLIEAGGPVGRRLDFLAQEFNRESNTLCSKANAASVTAIGLELKTVVDQFREQVQNLE